MFYEIKDKRMKTGTQTKWWLTAAFSGVVITASFIGIIFWLGITVRQSEPNHERPPSSFRDFQHHNKISKPPPSSSQPPSQFDYPAAEILKTTIKHKKGRVEMVDNSGEKFTLGHADSSTKSKTHRSNHGGGGDDDSTGGGLMESNTDEYAEAGSPDVQLRSKIAKLSSMQEYSSDNDDHHRVHLKDGISPLEEISPAADSGSGDSGGGSSGVAGNESNSVKKKSEAVLPSWYDQNLQNANPSKPEPLNELKQDSAYDLPDFSVIKPDLSAFNTKTIPAFTYLKEPLPHFEHTVATNPEISNVDDSLYYHHYHQHQHHPPHYHMQQQKQQQEQQQRQTSSSNSLSDTDDDDDNDDDENHRVAPNTAAKDDNSLMNFLQKRLQNMHDWLLYGGKRNRTVDVMELVKMVNNSFQTKNMGAIFSKFKDLYSGFNTSDVQNMPVSNLLYPTSPSLLNNSSSLVSFGLLAIDLFLLHNVQQIVWNEESGVGEEMLKDPDVVALNALFMSPDRVQQLRQTNSRIFTDREKKGVVHDLLEFINGGLRAVLNLSKAYKSSVTRSNANARSKSNGSTLDCIWTLYCRNLDKTAKLHGPYGFLAKMNSLGLRLMMGEFPVEKALDRLMKEYNSGWGPLDCDKLFPRCNADEAKEIVIQTALGRSTF